MISYFERNHTSQPPLQLPGAYPLAIGVVYRQFMFAVDSQVRPACQQLMIGCIYGRWNAHGLVPRSIAIRFDAAVFYVSRGSD